MIPVLPNEYKDCIRIILCSDKKLNYLKMKLNLSP